MASVADLVARVRERGANVVLENGNLRIVNSRKLPAGGADFIAKHHEAIVRFLEDENAEFDERAGIIQFDGKAPREWAEQFADILIRHRLRGVSDLDWSWFITRCGQIIDEAPQAGAA
ncbi:hypothetical protein [Antarcticirhabdus aurantiaca]|uniref:hypothetical protein n=1 Tax=Antarcticirhabdus aurantiaca TaxID=2606717 RepID=UPI00131D4346|nr:hypothetical protein [Antarcticirhabdus aurantiaca]